MKEALTHFRKIDSVLHGAAKRVRHLLPVRDPKRLTRAGLFASLAESVVSQQLSVKAADTIWMRLKEACGGAVSPLSIRKATLPRMRKAGLSAAKAKTLKELAKEVDGGLDLLALRSLSKEEATERLTKVWGIGPWTTEMFLMFALGHPDIFSARDLGLMRSMETLYGIKPNSPPAVYEKLAVAWSPHRTFASRVLWRVRDTPSK